MITRFKEKLSLIPHKPGSYQMKDKDGNKIKAGTVGAIEAVIKIINKHKDNDSVCEQGCEALCNMTDNNSKGL